MILLDCGNSQLKAECRRHRHLHSSFTLAYADDWSRNLAAWLAAQAAKHCYLCSVLDDDRQAQIEAVLTRQFGDAVTRFTSEAEVLGVRSGYGEPGQLGVDRWLALLAAAELIDGDCLVVDAGSAITLDLLRADGSHLGGGILPGYRTTLDEFKAIFSQIDFSDPQIAETAEPGSSTAAAIQIDYAQSSIEVLPDLVDRWMARLDEKAVILLTGGDAYRVQRELNHTSRIVPDLVFRGMQRLADA